MAAGRQPICLPGGVSDSQMRPKQPECVGWAVQLPSRAPHLRAPRPAAPGSPSALLPQREARQLRLRAAGAGRPPCLPLGRLRRDSNALTRCPCLERLNSGKVAVKTKSKEAAQRQAPHGRRC